MNYFLSAALFFMAPQFTWDRGIDSALGFYVLIPRKRTLEIELTELKYLKENGVPYKYYSSWGCGLFHARTPYLAFGWYWWPIRDKIWFAKFNITEWYLDFKWRIRDCNEKA